MKFHPGGLFFFFLLIFSLGYCKEIKIVKIIGLNHFITEDSLHIRLAFFTPPPDTGKFYPLATGTELSLLLFSFFTHNPTSFGIKISQNISERWSVQGYFARGHDREENKMRSAFAIGAAINL